MLCRPPEKPTLAYKTAGDLDDIKELDDNDIDSEKSVDLMQDVAIQDDLKVSKFQKNPPLRSTTIISNKRFSMISTVLKG